MAKTLNTEAGLAKLARILREARADRSYRGFEAVTGVSHATLRRLELAEVPSPEDATLAAIAPHTAYSLDELKAIAAERDRGEMRSCRIAEDVWPYVQELPSAEAARLAHMIIDKLAAAGKG